MYLDIMLLLYEDSSGTPRMACNFPFSAKENTAYCDSHTRPDNPSCCQLAFTRVYASWCRTYGGLRGEGDDRKQGRKGNWRRAEVALVLLVLQPWQLLLL